MPERTALVTHPVHERIAWEVTMPENVQSVHLAKHETYLANANECQIKAQSSANEKQKHTWEQIAVSWALLAKARASLAANRSSDASRKDKTRTDPAAEAPALK
jgi:hypothetical protein